MDTKSFWNDIALLPFVLASLILSAVKIWGDITIFSQISMLNGINVESEKGLRVVQQTTLSFLALRCLFECIGMLCQLMRSKAAAVFIATTNCRYAGFYDRILSILIAKLQPLIDAATGESGRLAWVFFHLQKKLLIALLA